jgi:hypothetical protein
LEIVMFNKVFQNLNAIPDKRISRLLTNVFERLTPKVGPVNVTTSTVTLQEDLHEGRTITLNRAAGIAVTLPASTGQGAKYQFFIGTTVTSNTTTIKVANASDIMAGFALQAQDAGATLQMFETGATDDTITFNGTTTGGIKGDFVELEDVSLNVWRVRVTSAGTGTEATCFSATV